MSRRQSYNTEGMSEIESHANSISAMLLMINLFVGDFEAALALFDFIETKVSGVSVASPVKWSVLPAREAVMSVWNVRDALDFIVSFNGNSLAIRERLESTRSSRQVATSIRRFQMQKKIRDTNAHPAGHLGTPEARQVNRLTSSNGTLVIFSSLSGREIEYSKKGQASRPRSQRREIFEKLKLIRRKVFEVIRPLDRFPLPPTFHQKSSDQSEPKRAINGDWQPPLGTLRGALM